MLEYADGSLYNGWTKKIGKRIAQA